jgi:hypothetical protein
MKYNLALQSLLIIAAAGTSATAQQENWDTYMARYGSKPGSVMVDMALAAKAPDKLLPFLVIVGPKARDCHNPQGIPDTAEINELENILNVTGSFLSGATAKKLAGTFTYNCERLNYYYVRDTTAVRSAISRIYAQHYPLYSYTLKVKHDPLWITYRTFLYPDSAATEWMATDKELLTMLQAGDNLSLPRPITHNLLFTSDTGRSSFALYASQHRYTITSTKNANTTSLPYEIKVSRYGYPVMDSLMSMKSELTQAAKKYRGYYEGWNATLPTQK